MRSDPTERDLDTVLTELGRSLAKGGADLCLLIHASDPAPAREEMRAAFPEIRIVTVDSYAALADAMADARPQLCLSYRFGPDYPREALLSGGPALIHVGGTGFDHLLPFDPRKVAICNSAGFQSGILAEFVLGAIYAVNLRLPQFIDQQRRHAWEGRTLTGTRGQHAVVMGTGPIGAAIAARLTDAGLTVTGISRSGRAHPAFASVRPASEIREAVAAADHLVIAIPRTDETRGLVSAAIIDALPAGATMINIARGGIVDETALLPALERGHLRAAVFDVFENEPLPADNPLWDAPNLIVTPHSASLFEGWEKEAAACFCDNLQRLIRGEALLNRVDPERGY